MLSASRLLRTAKPSVTAGMTQQEIVKKHCYKTWTVQAGWNPVHVKKAKGIHFWDEKGKQYIDFSSQLVCAQLGYQNEAVTESLVKQARELSYMGPNFATDVRAAVCTKLLEVMPPGIDKFFFPTSGTTANEAAIKVARFVTGKHKVICRYNSYHGASCASLAMTSDWRRYVAEENRLVVNDGIIFVPEINSYRPGVLGYCADKHMEYLDYVLTNEPSVAAVIMEPVVGSNGALVPPDDYWPKLRALTKKHNVLLIADEVMSSWGRVGEWFAVDKYGVVPDIITSAKGISNSVQPLGLLATSREIADFFEKSWFCHGHTFESHPMTLAPAVASISEYQRLDLMNYSKTVGPKLGEKLRALMKTHPSIGDVRGQGMLWCVDLVKNRATKEPFATNVSKSQGKPCVVDQVGAECLKNGVYIMSHITHLVIAPPLIITEAEMDQAIAVLDKALSITDALVC